MAEPRWLTDEEAQAWRRFTTMRFQLDARLDRQLGNTISIQDYGVLASLSEEPNKSMRTSELGERLGWETSRVSHQLTRMAKRGLVERRRCPNDGRGSLAVVTDAGQAAIEAAAPDHVASVRHLFIDLLTPEELRMISAVSQKVLGRLHDPADPTGS
jgi:DNA-binding MarR family transcriptional regulator